MESRGRSVDHWGYVLEVDLMRCFIYLKNTVVKTWACTQQVEVLEAKPLDPSWIPYLKVKEQNWLHQDVASHPHLLHGVGMCSCFLSLFHHPSLSHTQRHTRVHTCTSVHPYAWFPPIKCEKQSLAHLFCFCSWFRVQCLFTPSWCASLQSSSVVTHAVTHQGAMSSGPALCHLYFRPSQLSFYKLTVWLMW